MPPIVRAWLCVLLLVPTACGPEPQPPEPQPQPPGPAPLRAIHATPKAPRAAATSEARVDGCPREMARIGKVCIDRWEAHLVTRGTDGVLAWPAHRRPAENVRYEARSEPNVLPQAYVSRIESAAACHNAGKRLCSFGEWRRACQGKRWFRYPYGHVERASVCNTGKLHLLPQLFGADSRRWQYERHFNAPELVLVPGYLAATGEHASCSSEAGVRDLVGNLHEWVGGTVTERFVAQLEREDVERRELRWQPGNGIFVGGFFSTDDQLGPGCFYTTVAHEPSYHDYSTGFRCCADAID